MYKSPNINCVAIVAPAGKLEQDLFDQGIALLERAKLQIKIMPHVNEGTLQPYLSASAEARAADFMTAWLDPSVDMILAQRGGFGSAHILPLLDWELMSKRSVIVAGYSDITALHMAMATKGVGCPIAAPMLGKLSSIADDEFTLNQLKLALDSSHLRVADYKLTVLQSGEVTALPIVGNLTVTASLCGSGYLPNCAEKIIILEDLNESPYKIDRYITQLIMAGFFKNCAGIALGNFSNCGDREHLINIFKRLCLETDGPVVMEFPFGHEFPMASLNFAQKLSLRV